MKRDEQETSSDGLFFLNVFIFFSLFLACLLLLLLFFLLSNKFFFCLLTFGLFLFKLLFASAFFSQMNFSSSIDSCVGYFLFKLSQILYTTKIFTNKFCGMSEFYENPQLKQFFQNVSETPAVLLMFETRAYDLAASQARNKC